MWGDLANRLGANDINSTLQKIGNAVAPPPEDYEEYDDDEDYVDEGEDDDDDDDEDYDSEDEKSGGGFGFVGLLARALDDRKEGDEEEDYKSDKEAPVPLGFNSSIAATVAPRSDIDSTLPKQEISKTVKASNLSLPTASHAPSSANDDRTNAVVRATDKKASLEPEKIDTKEVKNPRLRVPDPRNQLRQKLALSTQMTRNTRQTAASNITSTTRNTRPESSTKPKEEIKAKRIQQNTATSAKRLSKEPSLVAEKAGIKMEPENKISNDMNKRMKEKSRPVASQKQRHVVEAPRMVAPSEVATVSQKKHPQAKLEQPSSNSVSGTVEKKVAHANIKKLTRVESIALISDLRAGNKRLHEELEMAKREIVEWKQNALAQEQHSDSNKDQLLIQFQEKEARLLEATTEEHQQELLRVEQKVESDIHSLTEEMAIQRSQFVQQQEEYRSVIDQSLARAEKAEADLKKFRRNQESQLLQSEQREDRITRMSEDKVAQTLAILDERDEQISNLKKLIRGLESKMNEHEEGAEEAEEDIEDLQTENESLQEHIDSLQHECKTLKAKIVDMEDNTEKFGGMQMELTMLREERDRERAKKESFVQSAMSSNTKIESERDTALSDAQDLKQQLTAALADLQIAKADVARITTGNNNLQAALETFQDERHAEMGLLDEQRREAEEAIACANQAVVDALRQAHSTEMKQIQNAADMAVKNSMNEMSILEARVEKSRSENSQMRRSLDEAIHRLQTSQEDVIDRVLMKNILLDWCTMKDKNKRHQVLELMASVLHFNEDEREKVNLTHMDIESVRSKVVGALAAPLPPSKADVDHLEGDNVREKFLNFLLAETDDGI